MNSHEFDLSYIKGEVKLLAGTDEAGRGPLAGPVVAAACILKPGVIIEGLDDSKKLTEKKREALFDVIKENCLTYCIASASPVEIDEINILNASLLAMRRAVLGLTHTPDLLLVDGNKCGGFPVPAEAVVKGDAKSQSIAAASVLAKVTRDRMCEALDRVYPQYGFAKHKGYPTKDHKLAVYRFGPCPEHRLSFLSFIERDREKLEAMLKGE
ncbi:MAG: ribonuclease HII [Ruminococcaceae bacterium]|nr:ribonuclease HII [Oscillospiraceae bacterium]